MHYKNVVSVGSAFEFVIAFDYALLDTMLIIIMGMEGKVWLLS
jgi:hypothetical protein